MSDDYNRFYRHNCNFVFTQSVRLIFIFCSFAIFCLLLYVWVKDIFAQIQFWILLTWVVAITRLSWASGREVVEKKMVERLRDEKLKDGSKQPENVAEVELPEDEKSQSWRLALLAYSLATPLVLASPIMF